MAFGVGITLRCHATIVLLSRSNPSMSLWIAEGLMHRSFEQHSAFYTQPMTGRLGLWAEGEPLAQLSRRAACSTRPA